MVSDTNQLLDYPDIESVIVFGGSWGATLAILFAAEFPKRVNQLILRGFFSATKECTDIYLKGGIKATHPKNWERVSSFVPQAEQDKVAEFFFKSITLNREESQILGYEWFRYGLSLSRKYFSEKELDQILTLRRIDLDRIRIELNYALNGFFMPEGYVYDQATMIGNIPVAIIQGRYDYICPPEYAVKLDSKLIDSRLILVDGGHSISEKAIKDALDEELNQL